MRVISVGWEYKEATYGNLSSAKVGGSLGPIFVLDGNKEQCMIQKIMEYAKYFFFFPVDELFSFLLHTLPKANFKATTTIKEYKTKCTFRIFYVFHNRLKCLLTTTFSADENYSIFVSYIINAT